jgi:hypothetical protein
MRKGEHVRLLSSKLEDFMASLFQGRKDLPRLVLENIDSSHIEAQPNFSPELIMYLDVVDRNFHPTGSVGAGESLGITGSTRLLKYSSVDLTESDANEDSRNLDSTQSALERLVISISSRGYCSLGTF